MNVRIGLLTLVLIGASSTTSADKCTGRVEGYIQGILLPISQEQYVSQDKIDWAKEEAKRVQQLRSKMPDCDVVKHISLLSQTDKHIDDVNKQIEQLKDLQLTE